MQELHAGVARLEALLTGGALRQSAWAPFLLGCLVASTALLFVLGLAAAAAYSIWNSERLRRRLATAAEMEEGGSSTLRRVLGEVLPAW